MDPVLFAAILAFTGKYEGNKNHIYLDSEGNCTTGIGIELPTAQSAVDLMGWQLRTTGAPAPDAMVARDWQLVCGSGRGRPADFYERFTDCILPPSQINAIFTKKILLCMSEIRKYFPQFDHWPTAAKLATIDWEFNAGIGSLEATHFFKAALLAQDWQGAADNCHRKVSTAQGEERNDETRSLFLSAIPKNNGV